MMEDKRPVTKSKWWRAELAPLVILAVFGVAASYLSVTIPYAEVYIEGRWIFGYMGFVLLNHWWTALLLAVILSLSRPVGVYPLWVILVGNMMYALPSLVTIRVVHKRVLNRLRASPWYGGAWLLLVLGCYQAFTTPALWGFLAYVNDQPVWPNILVGWREQPFLIESLLVGVISALAMLLIRSNAALRESRRELRTTLYSIGDGVIATDAAGRVRRMNPVAEHLTGWSEVEAMGMPLEDVFCVLDEESHIPIVNPVLPVLREGGSASLTRQALLVSRDGAAYPVADSLAPIRDAEGRVSGVVLIFRDQSEERAAQQAQQASHERLLLALRNARMGVWEWDMACNRVDYYGEYEAIFGMPGTALGNILDEFEKRRHPDDWEQSDQAFRRTLETGADFDDIHRIIWPDGNVQWLHAYARLSCDEEGRPQRLVGTVRNVTGRKQAEEERARLNAQIRDQAQQMAQVLEAVPAGILLLDAEGRVLQANPVAQRDLAILRGITVGDGLTHLGDRPLAELLTTPPAGLWHEVQWEKHTFEAITRPVERGPEPGHWVLVVKDVTLEREIRAQLQQQEQMAVVGQLAAGIAHDFNNIMAVISMYAQMILRRAELSSKSRERLEIILQQTQRATALIQQILDFSRRAVLQRQIIDLAQFLDEVIKLLERTVPENITMTLTYGADDYTVNADPTRLQQAIMNLVFNARDAMPEGGELRIALSRVADIAEIQGVNFDPTETGAWLRITVTDTGSGISPDTLPHIFEPFFTTKATSKGTGLGLAQVYGIVKHHEGHITVASKPGEETTFTLYLPASSAQPPAATIETRSLIHGQGETLLVVEDDPVVRQALVESVTSLNYQVVEARDGQEALALLEKLAGDPAGDGPGITLVLSDLVMPKMGGQALLYAIQQRGLKTPLVMLSGHPMESELEDLQSQGLAGWMLKPPDIEKLSHLLAQVLSEKV